MTSKNMHSFNSIFLAITRLKEKKLKCVGMVLPCVVRHIRSVQVSDELIGRTLNEEGSRKHLLQPAVKHVLDFLRPLVQEVNMESSCSENVRHMHALKISLFQTLG